MNTQFVKEVTKILKSKRDKENWTIRNKMKEKFIESLNNMGFKYLHEGASRMVFLSPDKRYVVKICMWIFYQSNIDEESRYDCQTKSEIEISKMLPDNLKPFFLFPLEYDRERYSWIIFPFVKCHGSEVEEIEKLDSDSAYDVVKELKLIFNDCGLNYSDLHEENVGIFDGNPVVIDYGMEKEDIENLVNFQ